MKANFLVLLVAVVFISGCAQQSSQNQQGIQQPQETQQTQETGQKPAFGCKDLLTDQDFLRIVGVSAEEFKFEGVSTPYSTLECHYEGKENARAAGTFLQFAVAFGPIGGAPSFTGGRGPDAKDIAGIGSAAYYSESSGELVVLSSNKKYTIIAEIFPLGTLFREEIEKESIRAGIARTVDANLNKY